MLSQGEAGHDKGGGSLEVTVTFPSSRFPWLKLGRRKREGCIPSCSPKGPDWDDRLAWVTPAASAWLLIRPLFSKLFPFGCAHPVYGSHQVSVKPLSVVGTDISFQGCFSPVGHSKREATSFSTQISKKEGFCKWLLRVTPLLTSESCRSAEERVLLITVVGGSEV